MASTRNNNTPGNYCLQQRSYDESRNYLINANYPHAAAHCTRVPGNGLLPKFYDIVLGKIASQDIKAGTPISWDNI